MIKLSVSTKGKTVGPQTDLIVEQGSGRIIFIRNSQCGPRVPFSPTSTSPPPPPPPPPIFIRAPRETSPSSRTLREDFFPRYAQRQGGSRGREREVFSSLLVPQLFLLLHFPFIPPLSLTSRSAPLTNRRPRIASPRAIVASSTCSHAGGAISSGIRPMFVRRDEERDFWRDLRDGKTLLWRIYP